MAQAFRSTRVLTPAGLIPATLRVAAGKIVEVIAGSDSIADAHDFGDAVLLPGLVDTHVHINEPGRTEWEGYETATLAAAAGGVTTLVDMPLNCVPETTDLAALNTKRAAAQSKTWVDWAAWAGVVKGNSASIRPLAAAGVPGFKCFLIHSGIDGFAWVDEADLHAALKQLQGTGLPLLAHAELAAPVDEATRRLNQSIADWRQYSTYLASRPEDAEIEAIALLIRLAEQYKTPVHIVHLSSACALPLLKNARSRHLPVTAETCTHYLHFAAGDIPAGATEYKCAPPLRRADNRERLWQALQQGLIDFVATDHSPCLPEMKVRDPGRFDQAWGGIASLGLALPVLWTGMKQRGIGLEQIGAWMASGPARLAGLAEQKGTIAAGADADFVVFEPDAQWTVKTDDLHFRHKISPYLGAKLHGRVSETWLRGEPIYRHGAFVGIPRGQELVRR